MPTRSDPGEAPRRLFLAVLRNLAEDLGCTGNFGGVALKGDTIAALSRRVRRALRFVEGGQFEALCVAAGVETDLWRGLLLRRALRRPPGVRVK